MKTLIIIGLLLLAWMFVSKVITVTLLGKSDPLIEAGVFLFPVILLYLFAAWLQMKTKKALRDDVENLTFGMVDLPEPSQDINDYLP